jgi:hypothetical protein
MQIDFFEANNRIIKLIESDNPFSVLRIDNTAGYVIDCLDKGQLPVSGFFNEQTLMECGCPHDLNYMFNTVYPDTIKTMSNSDLLGFVDVSGEIRNGNFIKQFGDKPLFYHKDAAVLDPGALMGYYSAVGTVDDPWTSRLKGKRVLVISTHAESIKSQWKNIDLIWGKDKNKIVPFELVDCIKTPYHPMMDDRQIPGCDTWESIVNHTKNLIDSYDYDVLLTSVTTQSPFYADHAKQNGKIGIQTGGTLQLFFGVLGQRWTKAGVYNEWHAMFNNHWVYPLEVDKPKFANKFPHLETTYAYW